MTGQKRHLKGPERQVAGHKRQESCQNRKLKRPADAESNNGHLTWPEEACDKPNDTIRTSTVPDWRDNEPWTWQRNYEQVGEKMRRLKIQWTAWRQNEHLEDRRHNKKSWSDDGQTEETNNKLKRQWTSWRQNEQPEGTIKKSLRDDGGQAEETMKELKRQLTACRQKWTD